MGTIRVPRCLTSLVSAVALECCLKVECAIQMTLIRMSLQWLVVMLCRFRLLCFCSPILCEICIHGEEHPTRVNNYSSGHRLECAEDTQCRFSSMHIPTPEIGSTWRCHFGEQNSILLMVRSRRRMLAHICLHSGCEGRVAEDAQKGTGYGGSKYCQRLAKVAKKCTTNWKY